MSIARQCELLGLARSTFYYEAAGESDDNLRIMRLIDEQYTRTPFYGTRKVVEWFKETQGVSLNRKRIQRLMRLMRLEAVYPKPRLTQRNTEHRVFPYLLRDVPIVRVNQVWSTDITYIRLQHGFLYLTAIIDWFSRYVLAWELSNTLDATFCIAALERALRIAKPEIFNTDQGCQFTCADFIAVLQSAEVSVSMDGKGRCLDNVYCERLWRTVKYEEVYLNEYANGMAAFSGLNDYFPFYNEERLHQSLGYKTPAAVFFDGSSTSLN